MKKIEPKKVVVKPAVKPKPVEPVGPDTRHPLKKFFDRPGLVRILVGIGILGLLGMIGYWISIGAVTLFVGAPVALNIAALVGLVIIWEVLVTYQARHKVFYDFKRNYDLQWTDTLPAKLLCIFLGITTIMLLGVAGVVATGAIYILYLAWLTIIIPYILIAVYVSSTILGFVILFVSNHFYMKTTRQKQQEIEDAEAAAKEEQELIDLVETETPTGAAGEVQHAE